MCLLFSGMLKKFLPNAFGIDALRHEVMPLVPQRTDDLGCECLIKKPENDGDLCLVIFSHGTILEMSTRAVTDCFYIKHELSISHHNLLGSNAAHCEFLISLRRAVAVPDLTEAAMSTRDSKSVLGEAIRWSMTSRNRQSSPGNTPSCSARVDSRYKPPHDRG